MTAPKKNLDPWAELGKLILRFSVDPDNHIFEMARAGKLYEFLEEHSAGEEDLSFLDTHFAEHNRPGVAALCIPFDSIAEQGGRRRPSLRAEAARSHVIVSLWIKHRRANFNFNDAAELTAAEAMELAKANGIKGLSISASSVIAHIANLDPMWRALLLAEDGKQAAEIVSKAKGAGIRPRSATKDRKKRFSKVTGR